MYLMTVLFVIVAVYSISPKSATTFTKKESNRNTCHGGNFTWIYFPFLLISKFLHGSNLQFEYLHLPRNTKIVVHFWFGLQQFIFPNCRWRCNFPFLVIFFFFFLQILATFYGKNNHRHDPKEINALEVEPCMVFDMIS